MLLLPLGYAQPRYWIEAKEAGWWKSGNFKERFDEEERDRPVKYRDPFGLPNHPVVGVSWFEAAAFGALAGRAGPRTRLVSASLAGKPPR